jgi:putative membrane protein
MINWLVGAVVLMLCAYFIPGIHVAGFGSALIACALIGLINLVVRPLFVLLTLPLTIVTLGLFLFVINALMFYFAGSIISGFQVDGAAPALLGSLVYSVVGSVLATRD